MNWDTFCRVVGDTARPFSTIILAGGIVGGMFARVGAGLMTIASTCFLALIGARATENIFQTKAATATAQIAASASTEDKKTAASSNNPQGVKP